MQAAGKLVARGDDQKLSWLLLLYVDVRLIERSLGRSIEDTIFTPTFFSSSHFYSPSSVAQQPKSGLGRLIVEVSRSRTIKTHTYLVRIIRKNDQLVGEAAT
jgi:hypothetical protein